MQLYIVRHGQSTGNANPGEDIPDGALTPLGEQQAREVAQRLAREELTHLLSSPLIRALGTATAIAAACDLPRIEVWPELQETRRAVHRGFGKAELLRRFPLAVFEESFEAEGWDHGGETYESGLERAADVIARLRERYGQGDRVAIAVHGAFANFLLRALLHMPSSRKIWFSTNNCSLTIVRFHASVQNEEDWIFSVEAEVLCVNDVSHLSEVS